mmetsp:Transcript_33152/g.53755  ORF Transcript_33152/g.53755 Transcript_33152/m.53755 type:complete len:95 (+) Transcript_33152:215-499(+)
MDVLAHIDKVFRRKCALFEQFLIELEKSPLGKKCRVLPLENTWKSYTSAYVQSIQHHMYFLKVKGSSGLPDALEIYMKLRSGQLQISSGCQSHY